MRSPRPVLYHEPRHSREVARVTGDEDSADGKGDSGNTQVHGFYTNSIGEKLVEGPCCREVHFKNRLRLEMSKRVGQEHIALNELLTRARSREVIVCPQNLLVKAHYRKKDLIRDMKCKFRLNRQILGILFPLNEADVVSVEHILHGSTPSG